MPKEPVAVRQKESLLVSSSTTDIRRIVGTIGYAAAGIRAAFKTAVALRQEAFVFGILIPLAFWWGDGAAQIVLLITSCLLVGAMELMNCAVEAVVDRIGTEQNELSGLAKDLAGAAVWVMWINLTMTWTIIGIARFS